MKRKVTSIIMVLAMVLLVGSSLSFAEETVTDNTTEVQENTNIVESVLDNVTDENTENEKDIKQSAELTEKDKQQIILNHIEQTVFELDSEEYKDENGNFTEDGAPSSNKIKWIVRSEAGHISTGVFVYYPYRQAVCDTLKEAYKMIVSDGELIDNGEYEEGVKNVYGDGELIEGYNVINPIDKDRQQFSGYEINQYASIYVQGGIEKEYKLLIEDNYVSISFKGIENDDVTRQYYRIENPQRVIDFLTELEGFEDNEDYKVTLYSEKRKEEHIIDWENMTINSNSMKLIDTLSFEVEITEKLYHSAFKQIANLGEKVKFEIKHIEGKQVSTARDVNNFAVITVSGSKGELCNRIRIDKFFDDEEMFLNSQRNYVGNTKISYSGVKADKWEMYIFAEGEKNDLTSTKIKFQYYPIWEKDCMVRVVAEGENVEYNQYELNETEWGFNKNLQYMFTTKQSDWIEEDNKKIKELYDKRKAMGINEGDYYVRTIAETDIHIDEINAPNWYKNLGTDVKLLIYGIAVEMTDGRECMPMLRLQGNGGSIWFDWTSAELNYADNKYDFDWRSLVSFSGKEKPFDEKTFKYLSGTMIFNSEENSSLEKLTLSIDDVTVELKGEDFNVLGKDNLYSDDLINRWSIRSDSYWEDVEQLQKN